MIDLERTRFIVTAWPNNRWPVETIHWIERLTKGLNVRPDHKVSLKKKNVVCARNYAVLNTALRSDPHFEHFVFIDKDVRPNQLTDEFLHLDADVKSCQVPMRSKTAWSRPDSFHEALWCSSRTVLEKIEPPYFEMRFNETSTEQLGCLCLSFREKVLAAGFTIAHGGWAEHDRDESWC